MSSQKIKRTFKPVDPKVSFPALEEEVLKYWKEHKTFEKSVESRPKDKTWTFLDGPPFVTGMPHYGSLLSSLPKDLFGRYWTMKGYRVRRVWGWDGHGLPIENKVENELKIARKRDIEEVIGVKKFIDECKHYVNVVSSDWEWYVDHIGRWVDFKNAYKTWDIPYMESVMWVFKQMYEKGLIYKGLRVSLYCPHCATPISNFEVAMDADNYKEVIDAATTYKYELKNQKSKIKNQKDSGKTYILAWSTTPWNKIVTPALAVNPELTYVKVRQGLENYILAKSTLKILDKTSHPELGSGSKKMPKQVRQDNKDYTILEEFKGSELVGKQFVPHYDYYPIAAGEKAFEIIGGDFVTAEEGTGVVTIAAYGEEDLKAMKEHNIHIETHLDEEGTIKPDVPLFGGMFYLKANKLVNEDLAKRGLIYKDEDLPHNVPLCWRCHTRLYYAPIDAWYVNVQELKEKMKVTNEKVNWFPRHFKYGRFLKSLENAPDWNISRNRYWGSPVPVWECECRERFVPGSIKELEERSGQKITELHKPEIDQITVKCEKCGKTVKRVSEVLDSWIEAGSASFAERHYPFDFAQGKPSDSSQGKPFNNPPVGGEKLEQFFPPDYIAEYTGQIRAWFYVLHVIGAALYDSHAFKNVSVTGVILGSDGRKMSKNFKNYPDPKEMLQTYGGDALRLYLFGSPVMNGEDILISEEQYRNQVKGMMLILWNTYNFFVSYANVDGWKTTNNQQLITNNILDKWILSLLNGLIKNVTDNLEQYDTVSAVSNISKFVNEFSTWYIRRSRERVGPTTENKEDKEQFYLTCYEVLTKLCLLLAPITPFLAESIYRNLTGEESVHLANWPVTNNDLINQKLSMEMDYVRGLVEQAHFLRKKHGIKVRQPLKRIGLFGHESVERKEFERFEDIIKGELNIKQVDYLQYKERPNNEYILDGTVEGISRRKDTFFLDIEITPELKAEGEARDIVRQIQEERKKLGTRLDELVNVTLPDWPKEFENEIKRKALIKSLSKGTTLQVARV